MHKKYNKLQLNPFRTRPRCALWTEEFDFIFSSSASLFDGSLIINFFSLRSSFNVSRTAQVFLIFFNDLLAALTTLDAKEPHRLFRKDKEKFMGLWNIRHEMASRFTQQRLWKKEKMNYYWSSFQRHGDR